MSGVGAGRRVRPVNIAPNQVRVRTGADGSVYMESTTPLGPYPIRLTDRLDHWAAAAPDRVFLAQRPTPPPGTPADAVAGWRTVTYAEALAQVRRLAQGLLMRGLSPQRTILILSGNSIEHALLALAAMYVGVPYAPIAPAYSLQATEFGTLRQVFARMTPGLVFAAEGAQFERALAETLPAGTELVVSVSAPSRLPATSFDDLQAAPTAAVDAARDAVNGDTIAKILFTSGSTGRPKGVINTQRMLCSNQAMIRSLLRFLGDEPPVLCCWLPWNHTAGGNHNFGIVLHNGGTFYIDEGKPTPQLFGITLRNLREIPAVAHFTVPRTYEMLLPHLRRDAELREAFFRKLKLYFYAAAGLGQRFWDELRDLAVEACGEELVIMTGFGATETSPFALCTGTMGAVAGWVGLPSPGLQLKLAPVGAKREARVKGPNVTPGYWGDEALTRAAFDDEGYYRLGDAMQFVDPADPGERARLRRPARRGLQALHRNLGQRRPAAGPDHRPGARAGTGRGDCRPRARLRRGAGLPQPGPVPRDCRTAARSPAGRSGGAPGRAPALPGDVRRAGGDEHRQFDVRARAPSCSTSHRRSMPGRSPTRGR